MTMIMSSIAHQCSPVEELSKYLGGVILFEETVDQKAKDGTLLPKLLQDAGITCGIKLDKVLG